MIYWYDVLRQMMNLKFSIYVMIFRELYKNEEFFEFYIFESSYEISNNVEYSINLDFILFVFKEI